MRSMAQAGRLESWEPVAPGAEPPPNSIRRLIRRIVRERLDEGQLDECDLTIRDLGRFRCVYSMLKGIYDPRVIYPDKPALPQAASVPAGDGANGHTDSGAGVPPAGSLGVPAPANGVHATDTGRLYGSSNRTVLIHRQRGEHRRRWRQLLDQRADRSGLRAPRLDANQLHALASNCLQLRRASRARLKWASAIADGIREMHTLNKQYPRSSTTTERAIIQAPIEVARAQGPGIEDADEAGEGVEEEPVSATEYVTGYEGDVNRRRHSAAARKRTTPKARPWKAQRASAVQFVTPPGWPAYLGDVVISYDTAVMQAGDYGHGPADEVDVLLVHGLLHLLGYDDHDPAERERMHGRQAAVTGGFRP